MLNGRKPGHGECALKRKLRRDEKAHVTYIRCRRQENGAAMLPGFAVTVPTAILSFAGLAAVGKRGTRRVFRYSCWCMETTTPLLPTNTHPFIVWSVERGYGYNVLNNAVRYEEQDHC